MKRFLLIPSCALLAFGMLTSCQKEDKTAQQLADELTAELQKVTDYKTAEAAAPRVEALNKRFQNAAVRPFSANGSALAKSTKNGYAESISTLAREIGRVQASKPVTESDGDIDEARLIRTVGAAAGSSAEAPAKEQTTKGKAYTYNDSDANNNNPPTFAAYYGSSKLQTALEYTANAADFGVMHFDSPEDCPAIPAAVEVADEEPAADDSAEETTTDATEETTTTPAPAADDEDDTTTPAPAADEDDTTTPAPAASDDDDLSLDDDDSSSSSASDDDDDALDLGDDL